MEPLKLHPIMHSQDSLEAEVEIRLVQSGVSTVREEPTMDPTAALIDLLEMFELLEAEPGDVDLRSEIEQKLTTLKEWIASGGAPPIMEEVRDDFAI
jgi:hypothetical protein